MSSRPKSVLRYVLRHALEGLMWMGLGWHGMHPPLRLRSNGALEPDPSAVPTLSEEEYAEWAALLERLR